VGRVVGFLADVLAVARLVVEARSVWGEWRRDGAKAEPRGGGDRERPDQPKPPGSGEPPTQAGP
jgi:hypothetical protein